MKIKMEHGIDRKYETIQRVNTHVQDLCENFGHYLEIFDSKRPFSKGVFTGAKEAYVKTLELIHSHGSIIDAIDSDECLQAVYNTLEKFGMNVKGARLVSKEEFIYKIRAHKDLFVPFEGVYISDLDSKGN